MFDYKKNEECMSIFQPLIDLVFPPFCVECSERTNLKYLCKDCWELSSILDLEGRCRHCFEEFEGDTLCPQCRKDPKFPFERAAVFDQLAPIKRALSADTAMVAASFAYYQWLRLDWVDPDLIIPIPSSNFGVAKRFADLCNLPCPNLFKRIAWPLGTEKWVVSERLIEENATILLIDEGCSTKQLLMAAKALSTAFPKKVYLISLYLT
jgi:hypothetical protein